jgi:hypothetical protein
VFFSFVRVVPKLFTCFLETRTESWLAHSQTQPKPADWDASQSPQDRKMKRCFPDAASVDFLLSSFFEVCEAGFWGQELRQLGRETGEKKHFFCA